MKGLFVNLTCEWDYEFVFIKFIMHIENSKRILNNDFSDIYLIENILKI
jgi:hypothetical protein